MRVAVRYTQPFSRCFICRNDNSPERVSIVTLRSVKRDERLHVFVIRLSRNREKSRLENPITKFGNRENGWPNAEESSSSKSFMGRILKVACNGGALAVGLGASKGAGAGLAEFKRVVRVAVNFLSVLEVRGGAGGGEGGVKGRGQTRRLASATYLSTIFYQ